MDNQKKQETCLVVYEPVMQLRKITGPNLAWNKKQYFPGYTLTVCKDLGEAVDTVKSMDASIHTVRRAYLRYPDLLSWEVSRQRHSREGQFIADFLQSNGLPADAAESDDNHPAVQYTQQQQEEV